MLFWNRCSRWSESDPVAALCFQDYAHSLIGVLFGVISYWMSLPLEVGHAIIVLNFLQPILLCSLRSSHSSFFIRVTEVPAFLFWEPRYLSVWDNRKEQFKKKRKKIIPHCPSCYTLNNFWNIQLHLLTQEYLFWKLPLNRYSVCHHLLFRFNTGKDLSTVRQLYKRSVCNFLNCLSAKIFNINLDV